MPIPITAVIQEDGSLAEIWKFLDEENVSSA